MEDTFGKKLQRWREAANISQAELARRIEVSPTYVSNLERDFSPSAKSGKPQPSVETCDKIARALGVRIAEVRLAAGYAPPGQSEEVLMSKEDEERERKAQASRTAEMIENWTEMSPEEQARVLAVIKVLREKHPESLEVLGRSFKFKTTDQIDLSQPHVKREKKQ